MRKPVQANNVLNFDGRRVLDDDGNHRIDGVKAMGSSTEVRVGLIGERIFERCPWLSDRQIDDDRIRWISMYKPTSWSG